jgi:hypothetical protein
MRAVSLIATDKTIPLGVYVAGVRAAIAHPGRTFRHGLTTWWPVTGADVRREFMDGVHDRINRHVPGYGKGRKWSAEWQAEARRAAHDVNTPRLAIRWLPRDLRSRLAHRLTEA